MCCAAAGARRVRSQRVCLVLSHATNAALMVCRVQVSESINMSHDILIKLCHMVKVPVAPCRC